MPVQGQLGGSGRNIVRLANDKHSAIGVVYDVREENVAFLEFSKHFYRHGLPVPEIYAEDLDRDAYLEEDLGDTTLFEFLYCNREAITSPRKWFKPIAVSWQSLPRFQVEAGRDLNYSVCYPRDSFDRQSIAWDLNYFKYYFLRLAGIPFNEQALGRRLQPAHEFLLSAGRDYFLYRDFQSRNVMLRGGSRSFWIIKEAGGARCNTTSPRSCTTQRPTCRQSFGSNCWITISTALAEHSDLTRDASCSTSMRMCTCASCRRMGAYGYRGFFERKTHFLQSVPYALKNLRWLLHNVELPIKVPTLLGAFKSMLASDKLQALAAETENLVVRVFSFSFHQGPPQG